MDKTIIPFALASLAVYRVSYMLTSEDGPFYAFSSMRKRLMEWERKRGKPHWIIDGMHCILCVSVYASLLAALFVPRRKWYDYFTTALALSGITLILKRKLG